MPLLVKLGRLVGFIRSQRRGNIVILSVVLLMVVGFLFYLYMFPTIANDWAWATQQTPVHAPTPPTH
jgi:hypothetical protein